MTTFEPLIDHRARLEQMQFEAAQRRERALIDQRSPENSPEVRVRIWERLHQVRLPKDPAHPIMVRVAELTGMDLAEVLEVQRLRAQPLGVAPA
jgi:hypothetical protein